MNSEQVCEVLEKYKTILLEKGYSPLKMNTEYVIDNDVSSAEVDFVQHLLWMCCEAATFSNEAKMMRWLGFIQGSFVALGWFSINELKDDNR